MQWVLDYHSLLNFTPKSLRKNLSELQKYYSSARVYAILLGLSHNTNFFTPKALRKCFFALQNYWRSTRVYPIIFDLSRNTKFYTKSTPKNISEFQKYYSLARVYAIIFGLSHITKVYTKSTAKKPFCTQKILRAVIFLELGKILSECLWYKNLVVCDKPKLIV